MTLEDRSRVTRGRTEEARVGGSAKEVVRGVSLTLTRDLRMLGNTSEMRPLALGVLSVAASLVTACEVGLPYDRHCGGGETTPISVERAGRITRQYGLDKAEFSCSTAEPAVRMIYTDGRDEVVCELYA